MQEESRGGDLTHIGEVLARGSGSLSPDLTKPVKEKRIEDCTCGQCGQPFQGEVTYYPRWPKSKPSRPTECPSCAAKRKAREAEELEVERESQRIVLREQWRRAIGMPVELLAKTFHNFEKQYQRTAFKIAHDWAKDFDLNSPGGYPSLFFYSDTPGVGKGHLMSGIVNYVLDNWKGNPERTRCPIRFESGPSLVRRIRATYNIRKEDDTHEREDEVYRALAGVPLLLLDDVGKETPSRFTRETYWYIIAERVNSGLPVLISSRRPLEGDNSLEELMGVDTVDRLYGMTRGQMVKMKGPSYRRREAVP